MTDLYFRRIGDAPQTAVFLHGLFGQGRNFTQIAKALQPQYQSVLLDLPNHGRSPWRDHVDYFDMADEVAHTIEQFGPVDLVGHSMGGKVAMVVALRHPHLVRKLVVVDISPVCHESDGEFEHLLDSLASVDLAHLERRGDADEQLQPLIGNTTVRNFLLQNLRQGDDGFYWQANLHVLRRDLPVIGDFPEIDATFTNPVLWVSGEQSDYIRPEYEPTMRALFPRTRLVTVKNAGHWVHSEQQASFISVLKVFLDV